MSRYLKELRKGREEVEQYVRLKDGNDLSALDYCRVNGRHDIYGLMKCFCSDGT